MIKKTLQIFILSFLFNLIWENIHSNFYIHYMGGEITQLILFRVSLVDATIISVLYIFLSKLFSNQKKLLSVLAIGFIISIAIELYALNTNRWAYNELMPIIPIFKVGLTPTIQLAILGFLSFFIVDNIKIKNFFKK